MRISRETTFVGREESFAKSTLKNIPNSRFEISTTRPRSGKVNDVINRIIGIANSFQLKVKKKKKNLFE